MNCRERLLAALNHQTPDRIPLDLGSTGTSTITAGAYRNLRQSLGFPEDTPSLLSYTAQSVKPAEDILNHFRVDTRGVRLRPGSNFKLKVRDEGDYEVLYDEWGIGYRRPKTNGHYFDMCYHPLADRDEEFIKNFSLPRPDDPNRTGELIQDCKRVRDAGFPVVMNLAYGFGTLHTGTQLLGYNDYFTKILLEPATIEALTDRILEAKVKLWGDVFELAGSLIDVVVEVDDLGIQRGPFMSPETYRKRIKPFHARLYAFIKKKAPHVKIFHHSCGSVVEFIPDLIEMGVDVLNPVQISAFGMDPAFLKREYGRDITFWGGGINTQAVLPRGTPEQIKTEVKKNVSIFAKDSGYVFATVHNIQNDVPPENIVAVFEAFDAMR